MLALTFHHLGLAVKEPGAAQAFLRAQGYQVPDAIYDPLQAVNLMLCTHPHMPSVEVIWPQGDMPSPVDGMLKKRDGLVYHICYEADDVAGAIAQIEALGLRVLPLGEPKPAVLFGGLLVSFYHVNGIGMIEMIHRQG